MRQLFFISPEGYMPVREAFIPSVPGARTHGWSAEGDKAVIGVVEMDGHCDAELVINRLEYQGILWMPNHRGKSSIKPEHVQHLSKHGVLQTDTTLQAMKKVHGVSGFPHLRPKRF